LKVLVYYTTHYYGLYLLKTKKS